MAKATTKAVRATMTTAKMSVAAIAAGVGRQLLL